MHETIGFGLTLAAILAGVLFNRNDAKELRTEIKDLRGDMSRGDDSLRAEISELRSEMHAEFSKIRADLRQFYHLTGKLEGRIDALEKR